MNLLLFQDFIRDIIEGADCYTHRTAVIFIKIGEAEFIFNISEAAVTMIERLSHQGFRGTFFDADPAAFTILSYPAMIISIIKRQVFDTGENSCQSNPGTVFRRNDNPV